MVVSAAGKGKGKRNGGKEGKKTKVGGEKREIHQRLSLPFMVVMMARSSGGSGDGGGRSGFKYQW